MRRLQCQVKIGPGSTSRMIEEATAEVRDALRIKFQARLTRIVVSLESLTEIRGRNLTPAVVEGGTTEELVIAEGDFDLILAGMKSECVLPPLPVDPEEPGLVASGGEGDAVPI